MSTVTVVVPVHNAWDATRACLESVLRETVEPYRLIVVDDRSDPSVEQAIRQFAAGHTQVRIIRNEVNLGFTRSVNLGLRAADSQFVFVLNSDTIVTRYWVPKTMECFASDPAIGIVSSVSNAASWFSVPNRTLRRGRWIPNDFPTSRVAELASWVEAESERAFPTVPYVNGFFMALRREVMSAVGLLDEQRFRGGYGSETDYCLRARKLGYKSAIADHLFIFHESTRSYSEEQRRINSRMGESALRDVYGPLRLQLWRVQIRFNPVLARLRRRIRRRIHTSDA